MFNVKIIWANGASVKLNPNTGGTAYYVFPNGSQFVASEIVADNLDPLNENKKWARIEGGNYHGKYVAVLYPSSANVYSPRAEWSLIGNPDPEPPAPVFPEWFKLTDPQGNEALYEFVRVIE